MKTLDLIHLPFARANLIEASAGTGKTFTLTRLFLRALLQDTQNKDLPEPIGLENILLVTFTNAATEELRQRIRDTLRDARQALDSFENKDATIAGILAHCENLSLTKRRLDYALHAIDQAQVMTIHGFCQRLLNEYALEAGQLSESTLSFNESQWVFDAVLDFWRARIVELPPSQLALLFRSKVFKTPETLAKQIGELLNQDNLQILPQASSSLIERLEKFERNCNALKVQWQNSELKDLMANKLKKNRSQAKPDVWLKMDAFCKSTALIPEVDAKNSGWQFWSTGTMEKVFNKAHISLAEHPFFRSAEQVADECAILLPELHAHWLRDALHFVSKWLERHKAVKQTLSPDDLLSKALNLVSGPKKDLIAKKIARQYPIAFIDEFQDTDPTQWRIFQSIYQDNPSVAVFYIGDPKQAIYGFRGADIRTYYQAKNSISPKNHYCLDTNWRSSKALVESINTLFSHNKEILEEHFSFDFQVVKAGLNEAEKFRLSACECLLSDTSSPTIKSRAEFLVQAAQLSASRIAQLLNNSAVDLTGIESEIAPGDITILVRDRNEATMMKRALRQMDINSVFLDENNCMC